MGLCLRGRDHTDTSLSSPSQPQDAWKEEHRFSIHPQLGTPSRAAPSHPKIWEEYDSWQESGGAVCVLLGDGVGQILVSGVTVAKEDLHGSPGMTE